MKKVFSVYQINKYIKSIVSEDVILSSVFIEGEISNFKEHTSGHLYFTLKDDNSQLNCVMFKGSADYLIFMPKNGMKVIVYGNVSLYEKTGNLQVYAEMMEPSGKGALFLAFEQLKNKLEKQGLFSDKHKKLIPKNPKCIAIVTSKTGAAVRDIINVSKRRNNKIELVVVDTLVQGENAPNSIANSISLVNEWGKADIIIVGRGGGSIEDLWAFNTEIVANSIFKSKIPIISSVGHETDFTISDFVSDLRAATPSVAAELATPELIKSKEIIESLQIKIYNEMKKKINLNKLKLEALQKNRAFKSVLNNIYDNQIYLQEKQKQLLKEMNHILKDSKIILKNKMEILESTSPMKILERGFSLTYKKEKIIKSINNINVEDNITIRLLDGTIKAKVIEIE